MGLPLAVAFALSGLRVVGVDTDERRIALLADGRAEGLDDGLPEALKSALASGLLSFASTPVGDARTFILAVPTGADADGRPDFAPLEQAFETVLQVSADGDLLALRSTVRSAPRAAFGRRRLAEDGGLPSLPRRTARQPAARWPNSIRCRT